MTEPITRRSITCNKDLCNERYDSDVDIGPFFDVAVYEEDIEQYTEEAIDPLVQFQRAMAPATAATIEFDAPTVEYEEPLTAYKVQKLKVAELNVELKWRSLSKNVNKAVNCNETLEVVINNLPIFNAEG